MQKQWGRHNLASCLVSGSKQSSACMCVRAYVLCVTVGDNQLSSYPLLCLRQHNKILSVDESQLKSYLSLEVLDLSSNNITEIRSSCFPNGLRVREL